MKSKKWSCRLHNQQQRKQYQITVWPFRYFILICNFFLCKNYVKLTYFIFQKNSRTTIMKSSESVRISGASSESMILLSRGRRPPSSSFGSVVVYFVLSLSLVQCGGHFLFWNRCQHFHEKKSFFCLSSVPNYYEFIVLIIQRSIFWNLRFW